MAEFNWNINLQNKLKIHQLSPVSKVSYSPFLDLFSSDVFLIRFRYSSNTRTPSLSPSNLSKILVISFSLIPGMLFRSSPAVMYPSLLRSKLLKSSWVYASDAYCVLLSRYNNMIVYKVNILNWLVIL